MMNPSTFYAQLICRINNSEELQREGERDKILGEKM